MNTSLHPLDIAVALRLCHGGATYPRLAADLSSSPSQIHAAVRRLRFARLLPWPGTLEVNRTALIEFIVHGLRYAFPAEPGRIAKGVPTAHSGPPLAAEIDATQPFVWPSSDGDVIGRGVTPLYPGAPQLRQRAPWVYELLTLVDALRVGAARERRLAREMITEQLRPKPATG